MNMAWHQAATDPQTRPNDPGFESACRLPEATATIAIYYYYSALKLITHFTTLPRVEGWGDLGTAIRCAGCISYSGFYDKHTTAHDFEHWSSHTPQSGMLLLAHCDLWKTMLGWAKMHWNDTQSSFAPNKFVVAPPRNTHWHIIGHLGNFTS